jgi:pilus assembly protein CpaF
LTDLSFPTPSSILTFARSIAVKNRSSVTKANALVVFGDNKSSKDFNLRINIGIEPVDNVCPHIVIRKIPKYNIKPSMIKLRELGMFDKQIQDYITQAYKNGLNVGIYGKGASGKSTLLNAAIEEIPEYSSKLCIQEIDELSSGKRNWIWQTVVKKEAEGDIEYDLYRLANNGLLLDIDYYIIGESKGAESMALFEALYTGHAVSFTAHAPSEQKGNDRVVLNMKKSGTDYSTNDLLRMTAEMDVSIFMEDFKVKSISEIERYDDVNNCIVYNRVFKYDGGKFLRLNDSCKKIKEKEALAASWRR